jgi:asparaginyl-tRNA synthetase
MRIRISQILKSSATGSEVEIKGWVRTKRGNKNINFIAVNDGSTINNIQVVAETERFDQDLLKKITTGSFVAVRGTLASSPGKEQSVEVHATDIKLYGTADPETYPLQKKGHTLEFLREISHLRPRTNTFGAVMRIRHALSFAIHKYFNDHGFYYLHTPIITASDAEGAGEMFRVTTLSAKEPPLNDDGSVNFSEDFFGCETSLTVSGQLEGELGAWHCQTFILSALLSG